MNKTLVLQLYARKQKWIFFHEPLRRSADIYVENGALVVRSYDPALQRELREAIERLVREGKVVGVQPIWDRSSHGASVTHVPATLTSKDGDKFVAALRDHPFWERRAIAGHDIAATESRLEYQ